MIDLLENSNTDTKPFCKIATAIFKNKSRKKIIRTDSVKRKGSDYHALAPQTGLEPVTHVGQKYGRLTRLVRIVILPISSCSTVLLQLAL